MIELNDLSFSYPGRQNVLRGITCRFEPGAHVAVMGANGSGKSSLALIVKGLYRPDSGTVTVDGFSASADDRSCFEVMKRVGIVFQNPDNTIVATTVERELAFGLENLGVPSTEMRARVDEALDSFDLARHRHASPDHLSGGERQRLSLAAVMVMRPRHLILDEPTSLLDPSGAHRIREAIREAAAHGTTVIHITQSAAEAVEADRVIVLSEGAIVRDGPPREVLADTSLLGIEGTDALSGSAFGEPWPDSPDASGEPILTLDRVDRWYDRGTPFEHLALSEATLSFRRGGSTVLLGPSGAGKTTLLEVAGGIAPPSRGAVLLRENPVRASAFQFPEDQVFGDTVREYVAFGPENLGFPRAQIDGAVRSALAETGLDPESYLSRDPLALSGGEKRRVALAGALAMNPDVLLLDEPTAGLDRNGSARMTAMLKSYTARGGILIFSTHDFRVARSLAGNAAVIVAGRIETSGKIREVFERSRWIEGVKENK